MKLGRQRLTARERDYCDMRCSERVAGLQRDCSGFLLQIRCSFAAREIKNPRISAGNRGFSLQIYCRCSEKPRGLGFGWSALALHQFDADAIGRRDVAQQAAAHASLQLDREAHAFGAELVAECREIALVHETEMV